MKLSRYYKKKEITEKIYAIFNSLIFTVNFVTLDELKDIENYNVDEIQLKELFDSGIYVKSEIEDDNILNYYKKHALKREGMINTIFLIPSFKCNLRCKYCLVYNTADSLKVLNMSKDVVDIFFDKYLMYKKTKNIKDCQIIFYGGEPLYNWNLIVYVINKFSKRNDMHFSIVTNGTLLTADKLDFIKNNCIDLAIS